MYKRENSIKEKTDVNIAKKYFTINPDDNDDFVSYAEDPIFNVDGPKNTKKKLISEISDKNKGMPFRRLPLPKDISKRINFQ